MDNMKIYNKVRAVPENAKKTIVAGRLKGMTDINPMWRIQALTEQFGPCGIGWKYVIREKRMEPGANGEIAAFVDIDLFYKLGETWSDPVIGTGGSTFVAKERNGMYTSDECFKMALTDALSVACKALGVGADVYWAAGRSKYSDHPDSSEPTQGLPFPAPASEKPGARIPPESDAPVYCEKCKNRVADYFDGKETIKAAARAERSMEMFGRVLCAVCARKEPQ